MGSVKILLGGRMLWPVQAAGAPADQRYRWSARLTRL